MCFHVRFICVMLSLTWPHVRGGQQKLFLHYMMWEENCMPHLWDYSIRISHSCSCFYLLTCLIISTFHVMIWFFFLFPTWTTQNVTMWKSCHLHMFPEDIDWATRQRDRCSFYYHYYYLHTKKKCISGWTNSAHTTWNHWCKYRKQHQIQATNYC